ncbi:MAG: bifunctional DNA-formamidopyrimidine glycosylase/DNA-(apurinic or apyrimidinic site) lyase [Nitrospira sp.]|nr:bifunctional DNA-formamidopyrimidine glycosylase/DNA-(apurinic or apyrimidinic site) lyase [Nitrospira sp.]MDH4368589.1 bifunctional DNA-formamidopyrimidine glycosylase/DNA-(apurinic or apyrimidinic site) lyase [Nitrospira sp.]MDH5346548.1 bifunctional DNA-formamidopyrimidine glycosylase/DNA-(apurinic or apyrimidinic site) lyase [Nitrospira sp.]MDH5496428.1 bifunctional DNA-formamidopyrimidine glycosylase/DNA-(apurinic or apyrimidinic site) lyase [Nitrospira sp.]MDH5725358.1 bifunctional DNA
MPELPEAEVVARQIRTRLLGARLSEVWVGRADIVREGLSSVPWYRDTILQSVQRFGKSVVVGFANEQACRYVVAELGMTGLLLFRSVPTKYPQHVHVRLLFEGSCEPELRYWNPRRFGRLSLLDKAGLERYLARRFGVDPLLVSKQDFVRVLRERRGRLKPLLMHQQVIAGIGNIYANEILFRAGVHPNMQVSRLSVQKIERLYTIMREVLEEAILSGGSSVRDFFAPDGTEGQYKRRHLVYGKEGQPCPNRCGHVIRRLQSERSSFICRTCQVSR